jgi:hypothetical protein
MGGNMPIKTTKKIVGSDTEMSMRLHDQLRVYKKAQEVHGSQRVLDELEFYPAHDPRMETPEYQKVHKKLVMDQNRACLVCGVRHTTLNDPSKNSYRAKQLETHHHVIEWALMNAVDVDKFNQKLLPALRARHPFKLLYRKNALSVEEVKAWIDHDEDNLWVLCDVHHRAKYFGIHEITHPIWGPVDLLRDDFAAYVREQIQAIAAAQPKKITGKKKEVTKKKP